MRYLMPVIVALALVTTARAGDPELAWATALTASEAKANTAWSQALAGATCAPGDTSCKWGLALALVKPKTAEATPVGCDPDEPCGCPEGCTCPCKDGCECSHGKSLCYAAARKKALDERKPLVVFVKQPARNITGAIVCRDDSIGKTLDWGPGEMVIVATISRGTLEGYKLPGRPGNNNIQTTAFPPVFVPPPPGN